MAKSSVSAIARALFGSNQAKAQDMQNAYDTTSQFRLADAHKRLQANLARQAALTQAQAGAQTGAAGGYGYSVGAGANAGSGGGGGSSGTANMPMPSPVRPLVVMMGGVIAINLGGKPRFFNYRDNVIRVFAECVIVEKADTNILLCCLSMANILGIFKTPEEAIKAFTLGVPFDESDSSPPDKGSDEVPDV